MMNERRSGIRSVTEGGVARHLIRLTLPSIGGMFAITVFNLTDTYFVSRLGTEALAAMGFTFPVVMLISSVSVGMATGAGSLLAQAMGRRDHHRVNRYATDGILLAVLMVVVVSTIGLVTMDPLFRAMGADEATLPLVKAYMRIWYFGSIAAIMPPVGDQSMRAMGDMVRPLFVMLVAAGVNLVLDPILIFGLLGFPAMGIRGAALATVIARAAGMVTTLSFVHFRYRLVDFRYDGFGELLESWKGIFRTGLPVATVRLLPQLLRGVLTRLSSGIGGVHAVAAIAAGTRIESFPMIIAMSVGVAAIPVVGQNWGAGLLDRVDESRRFLNRTAVVFGIILLLIFLPAAGPVARIFTNETEVVEYTRWYLWVMMLASVGLNWSNWTSQALTAASRPRWVLLINIVGTGAVIIPLTLIGAKLQGFIGMMVGLGLGQTIVGYGATRIGRRVLSPTPDRGPVTHSGV